MTENERMPLTQSVYLRHTDKEGHVSVHEHFSWDVPAFLANQHNSAASVGRKSKVEQLTEAQYREIRWPKKVARSG